MRSVDPGGGDLRPYDRRPEIRIIECMDAVFYLFIAWSALGVATAAYMARHGHDFLLFAVIGVAYGPLTAVVAWASDRNRQTRTTFFAPGEDWHPDGWIDVLVGLDGSDGAVDAAAELLKRFGPAIRHVQLAGVVDHEVGDVPAAFDRDDELRAHLREAAHRVGVPEADLVLLTGEADRALADHAAAHGIDLIVVGHRTKPVTRRFKGSTLTGLTREGSTPVLVLPAA